MKYKKQKNVLKYDGKKFHPTGFFSCRKGKRVFLFNEQIVTIISANAFGTSPSIPPNRIENERNFPRYTYLGEKPFEVA